MPKRAAIFTLGCRANQYDEMLIARSLMDDGFAIVPFTEFADLYVVNTCTVTHRGDADSRKAARRARRLNPDSFIVIAGCLAQSSADELKELDVADMIIGNKEKLNLARYLPKNLQKLSEPLIVVTSSTHADSFGIDTVQPINRSRALLKIQDGCDRYCTYCIVPYVRGKPRSLPRHEVLKRISELIACGYHEVVLTGIHLGLWGKDIDDKLLDLVRSFDELDGTFRIRLSSIEPMELDSELLDAIIHSHRIARHLHVPIQSACDRTLARMNRPYKIKDIAILFDKVKSHDSGWNIGTDFMIGFPDETDDDFADGIANLANIPINYFHLFTFSPRKGTPAYEMKGKVPSILMKQRLDTMKEIDRKARKAFIESQINQTLIATIEQNDNKYDDIIIGLSDNYIKVRVPTDSSLRGLFSILLTKEGCQIP